MRLNLSLNHPLLALGTRLSAAGVSFVFGVVAARLLGLEQFGQFSVMLAFFNVGVVVALLGHESLAVRNIAAATGSEETKPVLPAYRSAAINHVWVIGVLVACLEFVLLKCLPVGDSIRGEWFLLMALIPLVARTRLSQAMLRGAHLSSLAIIPDGLLRPLISLSIVVFTASIIRTDSILILVAAMFFSSIVSLWIAGIWERSKLGALKLNRLENFRDISSQLSYAMFASSLFAVLDSQLALIMVGNLSGAAQAGLYSGAERFSLAASLVGQAIYMAIASKIAQSHSVGDAESLHRLLRNTTRYVGVTTMTLCAVVYVFSEQLLALYGQDFEGAKATLLVLLIGVTLNAWAGPTGQLLLMTRNERFHLLSLAMSLSVQFVFLIILVPKYGTLGAAASLLASISIWNLIMMFFIKRRLNINPILALA